MGIVNFSYSYSGFRKGILHIEVISFIVQYILKRALRFPPSSNLKEANVGQLDASA